MMWHKIAYQKHFENQTVAITIYNKYLTLDKPSIYFFQPSAEFNLIVLDEHSDLPFESQIIKRTVSCSENSNIGAHGKHLIECSRTNGPGPVQHDDAYAATQPAADTRHQAFHHPPQPGAESCGLACVGVGILIALNVPERSIGRTEQTLGVFNVASKLKVKPGPHVCKKLSKNIFFTRYFDLFK